LSHQLTVIVESSRIPSEEAVNLELERLELPCRVSGLPSLTEPSGEFIAEMTDRPLQREVCFEDARGWLEELPELREQAGTRDVVVDFPLGADMAEGFFVTALCAVLGALADAVCYYQPDDLYYTPQESVDEARATLAMVE